MAQHRTRTSVAGVDIDSWNPGFWIAGLTLDNRTLSWLNIDATDGGIMIPPLTLGFALALKTEKQVISVRFVAAPYGGTPSQNLGDPILLTVYEAEPSGVGIVSNNGSSVTPPVAVSGTKRTTVVTITNIAAGGTIDVTFPVGTIEYTIRVVDQTLKTPIAWTFAYVATPDNIFHFTVGEGWDEPNINLTAQLAVRLGCAIAGTAEIVSWSN